MDQENAVINGMRTELVTVFFYISLAVSVILGVKLLGVVLVSALLIIPAATSRLLSRTFKSFFITTLILSELTILLGLIVSFFLDAPSGATIILVSTAIFAVVAGVTALSKSH